MSLNLLIFNIFLKLYRPMVKAQSNNSQIRKLKPNRAGIWHVCVLALRQTA